ncbi:carbamate kinase [Patescibacteria group bacterium]
MNGVKRPELGDTIALSLGGNALKGETLEQQADTAKKACRIIADIFHRGVQMVLTHGNGPQVGNLALRNACNDPLYHLVAYTQGGIGSMLQMLIENELREIGSEQVGEISTIVSHVQIDPNDPGFENPSKPIGPWLTAEETSRTKQSYPAWTIKELPDGLIPERPFRRVVPSPRPMRFLNERVIANSVDNGILTITGGGGGIPVIEKDGIITGIDAVIDKDRATAIIAKFVNAQLMAILTVVPGVIHPEEFAKKNSKGKVIPILTTNEAKSLLSEFPNGSMSPKVESCIEFTEETGEPSLIAGVENGEEAINGESGTQIVYSKGAA